MDRRARLDDEATLIIPGVIAVLVEVERRARFDLDDIPLRRVGRIVPPGQVLGVEIQRRTSLHENGRRNVPAVRIEVRLLTLVKPLDRVRARFDHVMGLLGTVEAAEVNRRPVRLVFALQRHRHAFHLEFGDLQLRERVGAFRRIGHPSPGLHVLDDDAVWINRDNPAEGINRPVCGERSAIDRHIDRRLRKIHFAVQRTDGRTNLRLLRQIDIERALDRLLEIKPSAIQAERPLVRNCRVAKNELLVRRRHVDRKHPFAHVQRGFGIARPQQTEGVS